MEMNTVREETEGAVDFRWDRRRKMSVREMGDGVFYERWEEQGGRPPRVRSVGLIVSRDRGNE